MIYKYRRLIIILTLVCAVALGVGFYINYLNSVQKITITFNSQDVTKLELYKGYNTRNVIGSTGSSLQTIESGKEYTVARGLYALKPIGTHVSSDLIELQVGNAPVKKDLDVNFTDTYLSKLLSSEQAAITSAIKASNPSIPLLYIVSSGKLYHHGEWYGALLVYAGTESLSRDTLRFVMKKESSGWKMISAPRQSLNSIQNTNVPVDILKSINLIDIGQPTLIPHVAPTTGHEVDE